MQGYLNHPRGAITLATRCTGESERTKCDYHASKLRECPPCAVGAAKERHMLTRYEHFNGTHWDGCRYGGHVGAGHTSINTHVISIARALGAAGSLQEVKLGPRDPNRAVDKESNPNQRGDGVLGNWTHSARRMVFDGTTITAVQFRKGMLGPLARGKHLATDYAEEAKRSAKAAACAANNYDFMTWASRVEHTRRHWPRGSGVVHHRLRHQDRPGALRRREVASAQRAQAPPAAALGHHCEAQLGDHPAQRVAKDGRRDAAGATC